MEGARALARENLRAFRPEQYDAIIVNSAGCGSTLKGYGHLLDDEAAATAFSARVRDLTEYLASLPEQPPAAWEGTVTYQEPCHLAHAQRISGAPRTLLRRVRGLVLREMRESTMCCGSAGVYNLTHAPQADRLLDRKLTHAEATAAEVVITANPGCLLQLDAGARARGSGLRVRHIADVLDEAERRAGG
jgi:glycolate oxidase iron-sulfur subunit